VKKGKSIHSSPPVDNVPLDSNQSVDDARGPPPPAAPRGVEEPSRFNLPPTGHHRRALQAPPNRPTSTQAQCQEPTATDASTQDRTPCRPRVHNNRQNCRGISRPPPRCPSPLATPRRPRLPRRTGQSSRRVRSGGPLPASTARWCPPAAARKGGDEGGEGGSGGSMVHPSAPLEATWGDCIMSI
jgi:hypothetical protein